MRSPLGNLFVRNKGVQYNDDRSSGAAVMERSRAVGQALKQFDEGDGWDPHVRRRDPDEVRRMEAQKSVYAIRNTMRGREGKLAIDGKEFGIPNLREMLGAREYRSGSSEYVDVYYTTAENNTVTERYVRDRGGEWGPVWDRKPDGSHDQRTLFAGRSQVVPGANGGTVIVSADGQVKFEGANGLSEGSEMRRAFGDKCRNFGRVISAAGGDDVVVLLQEDDQGRKTLTTMRVWSDDYDPQTEIGGDVHLRVYSVPVHPDFTSVHYESDRFGHDNIHAVKGKDTISSMSVSDVAEQAKTYADVSHTRRRENEWKAPTLPYQQPDPNRRRL